MVLRLLGFLFIFNGLICLYQKNKMSQQLFWILFCYNCPGMWTPWNDETHLWRKGKGLFARRGTQEICLIPVIVKTNYYILLFLICAKLFVASLIFAFIIWGLPYFSDIQLAGLLKELEYTEEMVYKFWGGGWDAPVMLTKARDGMISKPFFFPCVNSNSELQNHKSLQNDFLVW